MAADHQEGANGANADVLQAVRLTLGDELTQMQRKIAKTAFEKALKMELNEDYAGETVFDANHGIKRVQVSLMCNNQVNMRMVFAGTLDANRVFVYACEVLPEHTDKEPVEDSLLEVMEKLMVHPDVRIKRIVNPERFGCFVCA